jgi:S-adenosylmethionine-diacylglycerol 3-amino-3-carboxypropyl transferase
MSSINYSQCWEDVDLLKSALKVNSKDVVLSITSGGDNSLALLLYKPKKLFLVDKNPVQNYLTELKLKGPKVLDHKEYLEMIGVAESKSRLKYFSMVSNQLSPEAASWFAQNEDLIECGLIHSGKFEKYLNKFRKSLLPLVHTKKTILEFVNHNNLQDQTNFYQSTWNTWRWRLFFSIASNASILKRFARQIGTMKDSEGRDANYHKRLEDLIYRSLLRSNYYMCYSLVGEYGGSYPDYLLKSSHEVFRNSDQSLCVFSSEDLLDFLNKTPDNTLTKFNLSDFFEFLKPEEVSKIWKEIVRTAKTDAVVAYWCNQFEQVPPQELEQHIVKNGNLEEELKKQDRLYFYRSFHIYTIKK